MPVATLAYVVAEPLTTPYAMWAWLVARGVLAAVVQVRAIRRRLGVRSCAGERLAARASASGGMGISTGR